MKKYGLAAIGILGAIIILALSSTSTQPASHYVIAKQDITIGANLPRYGSAELCLVNGDDHLIVQLEGEGKVFDQDINLDSGQVIISGHHFGGVVHTLYIYFTKEGFLGNGYRIV